MIDSTSFLDTELSADDVVDFCLSSGNTASKLRMDAHSDAEFDLYDGEILRGMSYIDGDTLVTDYFDDNGDLHDWNGKAAHTVRDLTTRATIMVENYNHGNFVEKLMRVPLKSDFAALD
jgi:hypothetical protein